MCSLNVKYTSLYYSPNIAQSIVNNFINSVIQSNFLTVEPLCVITVSSDHRMQLGLTARYAERAWS